MTSHVLGMLGSGCSFQLYLWYCETQQKWEHFEKERIIIDRHTEWTTKNWYWGSQVQIFNNDQWYGERNIYIMLVTGYCPLSIWASDTQCIRLILILSIQCINGKTRLPNSLKPKFEWILNLSLMWKNICSASARHQLTDKEFGLCLSFRSQTSIKNNW